MMNTEKQHALLSASASHRWLQCPPSVRLSEHIEDVQTEFTREGTLAHAWCEYRLKKALNQLENPAELPSNEGFDKVMDEASNSYVSFVLEEASNLKNPNIFVEQRLDYSAYCPEGFGTGDCVIISEDVIEIIDFKYGQGVKVDSDHNSQMMLYALGAISEFESIYDFTKVKMGIFQPRMSNVSAFEMSVDELKTWGEEVVKPKAKLAYEGKGEFNPGSWCRFCKVKDTCRARSKEMLNTIKGDFKEPVLLSDEEIEGILAKGDTIISWINDIKDYALAEAVNNNKSWTNFKVVEGRSLRKYTDESKVAEVLIANGINPYEEKLFSVSEMEKQIGKVNFQKYVSPYVIKPQGKLTLVDRSDKRPEYVRNDFITEDK